MHRDSLHIYIMYKACVSHMYVCVYALSLALTPGPWASCFPFEMIQDSSKYITVFKTSSMYLKLPKHGKGQVDKYTHFTL